MNAKHTPEPWAVMPRFPDYIVPASDVGKGIGASVFKEEQEKRYANVIVSMPAFSERRSKDEILANSDRIVACVNACAGIEDPAELRRQRDELLEALEECADRLRISMRHTEDLAAHMKACKAIENATKGTK